MTTRLTAVESAWRERRDVAIEYRMDRSGHRTEKEYAASWRRAELVENLVRDQMGVPPVKSRVPEWVKRHYPSPFKVDNTRKE